MDASVDQMIHQIRQHTLLHLTGAINRRDEIGNTPLKDMVDRSLFFDQFGFT